MENVAVLTIADLINAGKPVTGASSLYFSSARSFSHSFPKSDQGTPRFRPCPAASDPNPKVLSPLNQPSILIGAISLPSQTLSCPNRHCLQFSDDSRSICCDVIRLEVGVIGERLRVLAWNFIPLEHLGGFLEIIEWKVLDSVISLRQCSMPGPFPLVSGFRSSIDGDSKSKYSAHGVVESVSPVSTVPCLTAPGDKKAVDIRGFLLRILACKCELCSSKDHKLNSEEFGHSFTEPVFVYFCGCTSCWHTVMTRLVGRVVLLSKMKKKLVFVGKENSQLMFVTNENSVLQVLRISKKWLGFSKTGIKETGKCGTYTGVVKGVYMEGMLVELDLEVWLILSDMIISRPHSLRVGALICIRNVHFVNPKFSWGTMLILGACFKTSITVESFSPWETGGLIVPHSESVLHKFINSMSFPARFWTLLIVSCFQKFGTEKEILRSDHGGLARIYANSHIPLQMFQSRHGVFTEFCFHESSGCNSTACDCNLKLVVPVSSFLQHHKIILNKLLLGFEKDINVFGGRNRLAHLSSVRKTCDQFTRKTFLSEDAGIILLGSLKISRLSGRLQLQDRIGSIDVIVPNLPSRWNSGNIYEVSDYCFTVNGPPELMALLKCSLKPFSCRNVFNCSPATIDNTLQMCISFCSSATDRQNRLLYRSIDCKDDVKELDGGTFHLCFVKEANDPGTEKGSDFSVAWPSNTTFQENVFGGLVSDLLPMSKENKSISFLCKVVSVHVVVLQKDWESLSELEVGFDIPLAGFVVDDGSSVCCCWAEGKRASTFLRLHEELPGNAIVEGSWIKKDDNWSTIVYHLERIVQKHKRILVRNVGSLVDTVSQDLTLSTRSDEVMTEAEEMFLKKLILNASNGPTWRVEARKMELNRIKAVEKEKGVEMRMKRHLMENAWAEEVSLMDPLTEARRLLNC